MTRILLIILRTPLLLMVAPDTVSAQVEECQYCKSTGLPSHGGVWNNCADYIASVLCSAGTGGGWYGCDPCVPGEEQEQEQELELELASADPTSLGRPPVDPAWMRLVGDYEDGLWVVRSKCDGTVQFVYSDQL